LKLVNTKANKLSSNELVICRFSILSELSKMIGLLGSNCKIDMSICSLQLNFNSFKSLKFDNVIRRLFGSAAVALDLYALFVLKQHDSSADAFALNTIIDSNNIKYFISIFFLVRIFLKIMKLIFLFFLSI